MPTRRWLHHPQPLQPRRRVAAVAGRATVVLWRAETASSSSSRHAVHLARRSPVGAVAAAAPAVAARQLVQVPRGVELPGGLGPGAPAGPAAW